MQDSDFDSEALYEAIMLDKQYRDPVIPPSCYWSGSYEWFKPNLNSKYGPYHVHPRWNPKGMKDIVYVNTDGEFHRTTGPAFISVLYDFEIWYKNGVLHNPNGWAFRHNKNYAWYEDGKLHNLRGPAVIDCGGPKQYWILGSKVSPTEWKKEVERRKRKGLL